MSVKEEVERHFKRKSHPDYFGPGTWDSLHKYAFNCRTSSQQDEFIRYVKIIFFNLDCKFCLDHAIINLAAHPPDEWRDYIQQNGPYNGEHMGMFIWSVNFHNVVNGQLKKPAMSQDIAFILYGPKNDDVFTICSADCDKAGHQGASEVSQTSSSEEIVPTILPSIPRAFPVIPPITSLKKDVDTNTLVLSASPLVQKQEKPRPRFFLF